MVVLCEPERKVIEHFSVEEMLEGKTKLHAIVKKHAKRNIIIAMNNGSVFDMVVKWAICEVFDLGQYVGWDLSFALAKDRVFTAVVAGVVIFDELCQCRTFMLLD